MEKRPIGVQVFCLLLLLGPLDAVLLMQFFDAPLVGLLPLHGLLFLAPGVANLVWNFKPRALLVLHLHGLILLVFAGAAAASFPLLIWPLALLALQVVSTSVYFFIPRIAVVYSASRRRGFRMHKRYAVDLYVVIIYKEDERVGRVQDISIGGAYIACDTTGYEKDALIIVDIRVRTERGLRCPARIMTVLPDGTGDKNPGLGIQFSHLPSDDVRLIQTFIGQARRFRRFKLALPVHLSLGMTELAATSHDLSLGGAYIATKESLFHTGDRLRVRIGLHEGDEIECTAIVAWTSDVDHSAKPAGLGLEFHDLAKGETMNLRARLAESGFSDN